MRLLHLMVVCVLGFASGLPLALTSSALQTWMTIDGIDIATIGFLSLVGLPATFKFLWAPLMDRFEPPIFSRRIGWLVITQLIIALNLYLISLTSPKENLSLLAILAFMLSFFSSSQDIVIDAYRTDVLDPKERGMGSSLTVFGYRLAMILSGGVALVWADPVNGNGWSWPHIYQVMSIIMLVIAFLSFLIAPKVDLTKSSTPQSVAKNDIIGFFAVCIVVACGYLFTDKLLSPLGQNLSTQLFADTNGTIDPLIKKWIDLTVLLIGIGLTLPIGWWATQKAKYETLNLSLKNYFSTKGAVGFLAFIILYKLGDAFAGALTTPFLLKGVGFTQAEIGVVTKVIGIWLTIVGALFGGLMMAKIGLFRSLLLFGVLQMISNLGFWLVSISEKGSWGTTQLPAFDLLLVTLKEPTNLDFMLLFSIGIENLTGGMGTDAFVAFLMALCNQKFTATQYALLSAFSAIGRVWVGPLSGVLSLTIGWPMFFIFSTFAAIPGLYILMKLKNNVVSLEVSKQKSALED